MYYNSSVWLDMRDASSWDRNSADGYLIQKQSSFSALVKDFFMYIFLYLRYRLQTHTHTSI